MLICGLLSTLSSLHQVLTLSIVVAAATWFVRTEVCSLYYVLFFKYNKKEQP